MNPPEFSPASHDPQPARCGSAWRLVGLCLLLPIGPALITAWLHPRRPDWAKFGTAPAEVRQITLATARTDFADALWIDAREAAAFAVGHVPDALNLNETSWDAGFDELMAVWADDRPLIIYCAGENCHASEAVARRLKRELGVENIVVLRGGWDAWTAAPPPTDTPPQR